ncbi:MAG: M20/M25/M40 family metallo-hydrolase [Limnochordia bacterium]|jgi:arginine utilization protein RocB|nr:M20/M25/M40 family metallo-hydrolase [Limnochordia bacterium]MDI9465689.1 M20/M25/M40 family metallo-hydrolase [Bacillota bacterium]NLO96060.1 M20/M25/M40 family metallo-hydrolase [Bacillota bacterium]HAN94363.1 peptidase M20 [Bacillota bacterium]HOB41456.1 M20/M25/M40 family metallo-hydrolase [Limnochordia bacterium]
MYLHCFDDVKRLTVELVKIPSMVKTSGEAECARRIHEFYQSLPYFQKHPEHLVLQRTEDDEIERYNVLAMVKGTGGDAKRTVILMGHIDTVGVDDFGSLKEYAFDPERLPEVLRQMDLGEDVRRDLDSGEYMFGRGALDMKAGVAGQMWLIRYFSQHPEELNGNLIAIAECDEEDNSHGIISALKVLKQWKAEHGLEYVAAINADYSTPYHELDENRYVYFGTIGKLLPTFYVVGKETHVGQAFGGLNPNLLVAELTRLIELNPELCDEAQGEVTVPPTSLKQADCKDAYTVQTPLAAYAYYNVFTHSLSPREIMAKMKEKAREAFDNVITYLDEAYRTFCQRSGHTYTRLPWKTRVYTWEEFYSELVAQHGEGFVQHLREFARELQQRDPALDLRDFNVRLVAEAWQWARDKSPAIIVFNSSTYFARIEMTGRTEAERRLLESVKAAVSEVQPHSDRPIVTKMFYPYISDSSFMALGDEREELDALEKNTPAWGVKYTHPIEDIAAVNVPVVNIGTFGKDGHKLTERVHMRHTFELIPNITFRTIKKLLG